MRLKQVIYNNILKRLEDVRMVWIIVGKKDVWDELIAHRWEGGDGND